MTNDDMMTEGGGGRSKMTKLLMLIFQSSFIKPSLEICLVTPKEGIVTLRPLVRVAGLAVPG